MSFFGDFKFEIKLFLLVAVVAIVIVVGAILLLRNGPDSVPREPQVEITGEMRIEGVVLDIDSSQMVVDGDGIVTVQTSDRQDVIVLVPAGERQCSSDTEAFHKLQPGDQVEVFGRFTDKKATLCESPEHYLRLISDEPIDTSDFTLSEIEGWQTYRNEEFGFEVRYPSDYFYNAKQITENINTLFYGQATKLFASDGYVNGEYVPTLLIIWHPLSIQAYQEKTKEYNQHFGYKQSVFEQVVVNGQNISVFDIGSFNMGILCSGMSALSTQGTGIIGLNYTKCEEENAAGLTQEDRDLFTQILSTFRFLESIGTSGWQTYRNEEFGFEMRYSPDILFTPEQVQYAPILRSFSTTSIEASPAYDLAIYVGNIKVSAFEDAKNKVKDLPVYIEGLGPYEEQIGDTRAYITVTKLYDGFEGLSRSYYFPKFVLRFSFANNTTENKFKNVEQQIFSTFQFIE